MRPPSVRYPFQNPSPEAVVRRCARRQVRSLCADSRSVRPGRVVSSLLASYLASSPKRRVVSASRRVLSSSGCSRQCASSGILSSSDADSSTRHGKSAVGRSLRKSADHTRSLRNRSLSLLLDADSSTRRVGVGDQLKMVVRSLRKSADHTLFFGPTRTPAHGKSASAIS